MKMSICSNCADIHAKNVVDMYKDLKSPFEKIRSEDEVKARGVLDRLMHDGVTLGLYKEHGPLNVEMDKETTHILDQKGQRLCSDSAALDAVRKWKQG